jgi:Pyruvate/2-oxoacid:ferredoxin oxidoreductase delta subunit
MCDLCTKHGEGTIWYKNARNYGGDLLSDLRRRGYIENFLKTAFKEGFETLGRVEAIYRKKGRLPEAVTKAMAARAKEEHYGQVLPIEEINAVVKKARTVVRMPCACRWNIDKKEERRCYAVSYGPEAWYDGIDMSYFGKASDEGLEALAPDVAVAQMEAMEADGAVHTIWTMMTPFIGAVCNCSPRECLAMMTLTRTGVETMERAEFVARVDEARCTGCGLCDSACHFHAITSHTHGGERHARIDPRKCFGCGLCRRVCGADAIALVPR